MTKIEWATHTWNPVIGCSRVSPGCENCYAERMSNRLASNPQQPVYKTIAENGRWTGKTRSKAEALNQPHHWKKPRRVFVGSMTDIFHPATPVLYVQKLFKAMAENPKHTFMVLTKRPEQLHMMNDSLYFAENIWLGVSVEDRKRIERLDVLRKVDTPNRFVSFEPLLEEIRKPNMKGIKWAIIGGESGPYARRCNYNWIYKLAIDCRQSGSKIFIKQLGNQEAMICECSNRKGAEPSEWPFALREALKPNREFPDGMVI